MLQPHVLPDRGDTVLLVRFQKIFLSNQYASVHQNSCALVSSKGDHYIQIIHFGLVTPEISNCLNLSEFTGRLK